MGIPKEVFPLEKRVALSPSVVKKLVKLGFSIQIETGAGEASGFSDLLYEKNGADIVTTKQVWEDSETIIKIRAPCDNNSSLG